jgi:hypothetical protein
MDVARIFIDDRVHRSPLPIHPLKEVDEVDPQVKRWKSLVGKALDPIPEVPHDFPSMKGAGGQSTGGRAPNNGNWHQRPISGSADETRRRNIDSIRS